MLSYSACDAERSEAVSVQMRRGLLSVFLEVSQLGNTLDAPLRSAGGGGRCQAELMRILELRSKNLVPTDY